MPDQNLRSSERRFRTIVADPPWEIDDFPANFGYESGKRTPYTMMSVEAIRALPVRAMAEPTCDLYLWTINQYVETSYDIARAWGFDPTALLTWCKPRFGVGMGGKFPGDTEFILYATRTQPRPNSDDEIRLAELLRDAQKRSGKPRREIDEHFGTTNVAGHWFTPHGYRAEFPTSEQWPWVRDWLGLDDPEADALVAALNARKGERVAPPLVRGPGRWFEWPRGRHSVKPEAFLDMVEMVSPGPYLELFARRARFGWEYWGNESLSTVEMPDAA